MLAKGYFFSGASGVSNISGISGRGGEGVRGGRNPDETEEEFGEIFLTSFGEMKVSRRLYQADRGGDCYIPLDEAWGMKNQYATVEVQESLLFACAHLTPCEVEALLNKSSLFHPDEKTIQRVVTANGQWIEAHEVLLRQQVLKTEEIPKETEVFSCSMDGVNLLIREAGSKTGRPVERPVSEEKEEVASAYRNAMVGSFSFYQVQPKEERLKPERLQSHYVGRMPEAGWKTFRQEFEQEIKHLEERLPPKVVKVMLNDGQRALWNYVDLNPLFEDFEKLVDFFHASEHLSHAAEALFGKQSSQANLWYKRWYDKLQKEEGAVQALLNSMNYHQQKQKLSSQRQEMLRKEQQFFWNNQRRMNYADFLKRGLPIGSGTVEAACKSVVKTRMARSGMRWSRKGGQHILTLRAYVKSGRWDRFWKEVLLLKRAG